MSRFFPNPYPDYPGPGCVADPTTTTGVLHESIRETIQRQADRLLGMLETQLQQQLNWRNFTVYTGVAGVSLLYLRLARLEVMSGDSRQRAKYLERGLGYLESHLTSLRDLKISTAENRTKVSTFLCGEAGALVVGSALYHEKDQLAERDRMLMKLISLLDTTTDPKAGDSIPDELLYGRCGFMYGLLWAQQQIPSQRVVTPEHIRKVVEAVLSSGRKTASREATKSPLFYYWHGKPYLGAAHGLAGILYMCLQSGGLSSSEMDQLIRPAVDYILTLQTRSGNFPTRATAISATTSDDLVHWCHGAPGIVHVFCAAHAHFHDDRYLAAALSCGEVIWSRGLLKKGYSLCHGAAGNGYAFLALYQLTRDEKHLYRALKFGEWIFEYGTHGCRAADNPASLAEGLAGSIYYLTDLMDPLSAKFPGFQI